MISVTYDVTYDLFPGFCAIAVLHSWRDGKKEIGFRYYNNEAETPRQLAEAILNNFTSFGGKRLMICDKAKDYGMHGYIIKHFKDGELWKAKDGRVFKIAITEPYRNPNSGNNVVEMSVIRTDV